MTALDRSFIKAYDHVPQARQDVSGPAERPAQAIPAPHFVSAATEGKPPAASHLPADQVAATAEMQRENGMVTLRFDIPSQLMSFDNRPHTAVADAEQTDEQADREQARSNIASILAELAGKPAASNDVDANQDAEDRDQVAEHRSADVQSAAAAHVAAKQAPAVAVEPPEPEKPASQPAPTRTPQPAPPRVTTVHQEPPAATSDAGPPEPEFDFTLPQTALLYGGAQIIRIDAPHPPVAPQTPITSEKPTNHETIDVATPPLPPHPEPAPSRIVASEEQDAADEQAGDKRSEDREAETTESPADKAEPQLIWTRPAFEVDQFVWPDVCQMLSERAATELTAVAEEVWKRARSGRNIVAVVGNRSRQGRTIFMLCLARRLAEMELRVAVVDGNFQQPAVAGTLGVATQTGWDDAIANHLPVSEAVIESIDDRLTIVPLRSNRSRTVVEAGEKSFPTVTRAVRGRFDVVLVDLAPCNLDRSPSWLQRASGIDWAIVMGDCDAHADQGLAELVRKLSDADVKPIGIVEHELLA